MPQTLWAPVGLRAARAITSPVEVLRPLARGLSNREIAERLVISTGRADRHNESIYGKIGARNRAQASLFAVKHALIGAEPVAGLSRRAHVR